MEKISYVIFWLLAILSPVYAVMGTIVFLIIVDFVTGVFVTYKKKKQLRTVHIVHATSKVVIYNLVVLSAFLLEQFIIDEVPFLKIISGFIAVFEIKSIMQNFDVIYGVNLYKVILKALNNKANIASLKNKE